MKTFKTNLVILFILLSNVCIVAQTKPEHLYLQTGTIEVSPGDSKILESYTYLIHLPESKLMVVSYQYSRLNGSSNIEIVGWDENDNECFRTRLDGSTEGSILSDIPIKTLHIYYYFFNHSINDYSNDWYKISYSPYEEDIVNDVTRFKSKVSFDNDVNFFGNTNFNSPVEFNKWIHFNADLSFNAKTYFNQTSYFSNDIGIGISSPSAPLHISRIKVLNGSYVSAILGSNNHWTHFGGTTGGRISGSNTGALTMEGNPKGTGDKNLYLNKNVNSNIILGLGGGNVGIGTGSQSPRVKLDVRGNAIIDGNLKIDGYLETTMDHIIHSNLFVNGKTTAGGDLFVNNKATIGSDLFVNGKTILDDDLFVDGNVDFTGEAYFQGVGIGTKTPNYSLDVNGGVGAKSVSISGESSLNILDVKGSSYFADKVGIGIINVDPDFMLQVKGQISAENLQVDNSAHIWEISTGGTSDFGNLNIGRPSWNRELNIYGKINVNGVSYFSGNVGIGTIYPEYTLDVKGIIRATEIKIESIDNFPDYVFESNYLLPALDEVDRFIQANGHLPEIPSAKEVSENGLNMAEMQIMLLKKIEELTLYLIEQQQKIQSLEAIIRQK